MSTRAPIIVCLGVAVLSVWEPCAHAESAEGELRSAKNLFIYQDFPRALQVLEGLLRPEVRLEEAEDILAAREMFAASLWYLGNKDAAQSEFTLLLVSFPRHRLDPFQHPPDMISFYESVRDSLIAQRAIDPDRVDTPPQGDGGAASSVLVIEERVVHHQPFITTLIPFGVGQYQNGDTALGTVLLVSQVLALSATVASYFLILDTRVDDPRRARQFETAFWASQGAFWALAVGGIVEAMVSYEGERVEVNRREVPLGPDPAPPAGGSASWRPSLNVLPEGGATLGVGGRF